MKTSSFYILLIGIALIAAGSLHAQTNDAKADSLKNAGKYAEALKVYEQVLQADLSSGNEKKTGKDYNNIANIYSDMGDYEKSTGYYFKSLRLIEKHADKTSLAGIYYNIANNYYMAGKRNYSADFLTKAIRMLDSSKGNKYTLAVCYNLLGGIKTAEKNYKEAFEYMTKAASLFKSAKQTSALGSLYTNICCLALEQKKYKLAEEYAHKSLDTYKEQGDITGVAISYINLYKAFLDPYDTGAVLNRKNGLKAIGFLDSAEFVLSDINSPEVKTNIYQHKQYVYSRLNQFDSAYIYLGKYWTLEDSIHNVAKNKQLEEEKIKYEVEKKEQENILLQKTSQNEFYLIIILSISLIAIVLISILSLRLNTLRNKQEILLLEQKLLRLQMNPHFLFNAISSIQKYILKKDKQEAYNYLAKFAKLIRIVLNNSQGKTLLLHQELEMIKLYVELEQLRFNNAFDFYLTISDQINEYETEVPTMLIQPYIENAIWHGLMNLENECKGVLKVDIKIKDETLQIVVEDNGIGRERAKQFKKEESYNSLGMKLTEQRLLLINKMDNYEKAKVLVTDVINENANICGTKVEIFIPVNGK